MARTYKQECILAHALDLLGERWTLLIVRDLFLGPRRFGDLQAGLQGLGTNLLSKRLKDLEDAGLIESAEEGSVRSQYKLSVSGEALRPAIKEMMMWSIDYFMSHPSPSPARDCIKSDDLRPDSVALGVELFANHFRDERLNYVAHLFIDDFPYTVYYMNGSMTVRRDADTPAIASISGDVSTFMQGFRKEIPRKKARAYVTADGNDQAIEHLLDCIIRIAPEMATLKNASA